MTQRAPALSVVTPFYNTAPFLAECIESVLKQRFGDFELLLVDNCSTDGSAAIAQHYAAQDARVRFIRNERFVGQVENYNGAVRHIAAASRFVKIVQADDWIFPECLGEMIAVGDANPNVGIIGSYYVEGDRAIGWGVPPARSTLPGRDACRAQLLGAMGVFGSPTTLMYRADLVRGRDPFYPVGRVHEDTELCFELLKTCDFGFVHQILSYVRVSDDSITGRSKIFNGHVLDEYMTLRTFGPVYLSPAEYTERLRLVRGTYMQYLGECAFFRRGPEAFQYHNEGLSTIGERISPLRVAPYVARAALKALKRPSWAREGMKLGRARRNGGSVA